MGVKEERRERDKGIMEREKGVVDAERNYLRMKHNRLLSLLLYGKAQ
jgi:hypothetical protein